MTGQARKNTVLMMASSLLLLTAATKNANAEGATVESVMQVVVGFDSWFTALGIIPGSFIGYSVVVNKRYSSTKKESRETTCVFLYDYTSMVSVFSVPREGFDTIILVRLLAPALHRWKVITDIRRNDHVTCNIARGTPAIY